MKDSSDGTLDVPAKVPAERAVLGAESLEELRCCQVPSQIECKQGA